jgi:hypothetical protein
VSCNRWGDIDIDAVCHKALKQVLEEWKKVEDHGGKMEKLI